MDIVIYEVFRCSPRNARSEIRAQYQSIVVLVKEFVQLVRGSGTYLAGIYIKIFKAWSIYLLVAVVSEYLKELKLKP